jgi:hypothetical protein
VNVKSERAGWIVLVGLLVLVAIVEAKWATGLMAKNVEQKRAEQVAVATREKIDCEHFLEWMHYAKAAVSRIEIKGLESEIKGGDSRQMQEKMKLELYEAMFSSMSNTFRPMVTSGVRIRGLVLKPGRTTVRIKCDEAPSEQLRVCENINRSGVMNGEPTQFGFCQLRCDPKRFGETSHVDLIGDDLQIVTFTNENSETYQCNSYKPR